MSSSSTSSTVDMSQANTPVKGQEENSTVRSEKFWIDDGNVILQVENTRFRVHRSTLSRHSNVFRDMFTIAQKKEADDSDQIINDDGCPVVELSDKAGDVEHMLSVFYDHFQVHDWRKPMSIAHLSAILRLGKKYEIDYFVQEALTRLRSDNPTTLELWEDADPTDYDEIEWGDDTDVEVEIEIINLALEQSVLSILPVAYLRYLANYSMDRIVTGNANLCSEGRIHATLGRAYILDYIRDELKDWYNHEGWIAGKGCTSREACTDSRFRVFDFQLWSGFDDRDDNMLESLSTKSDLSEFCPKCAKVIRTKYDKTRAQLWEKIPIFFGLSKWEDLKDFDM